MFTWKPWESSGQLLKLNPGQPTIIQHLHSRLYSQLPTTNESICLFVQGTLCKIMLVGNWDGSVAVCVNYAQFFDETRRAPKNLVSCQGNREILHRNVLQTIVRYAQDRLAPIPNARFAYLKPKYYSRLTQKITVCRNLQYFLTF